MEGLQNCTQIIEDTSSVEWLVTDTIYANIKAFYTISLPEQPTYAFVGVYNTDGGHSFTKVDSTGSRTIFYTGSGYGSIEVTLTSSGITLS